MGIVAGFGLVYLVCWLCEIDWQLMLVAMYSSAQSLPRVRLRMNGFNQIIWSSKWVRK